MLTETHNAEGVATDPSRALRGVPQRFGARHFLAISNHHREPIGATIQVEDQAYRGISDLLYAIARDIAHGNTCSGSQTLRFKICLYLYMCGALGIPVGCR